MSNNCNFNSNVDVQVKYSLTTRYNIYYPYKSIPCTSQCILTSNFYRKPHF